MWRPTPSGPVAPVRPAPAEVCVSCRMDRARLRLRESRSAIPAAPRWHPRPRRDEGGRAMRSIWKGAVSFGLVSITVKLYSATEEKDIRFHQIHAKDGGRIRYTRTCQVCGE